MRKLKTVKVAGIQIRKPNFFRSGNTFWFGTYLTRNTIIVMNEFLIEKNIIKYKIIKKAMVKEKNEPQLVFYRPKRCKTKRLDKIYKYLIKEFNKKGR